MEETQTAQTPVEDEAIVNADANAVGHLAEEAIALQHKEKFGGRTEAQILGREPIKIQLGGKSYEIRPAVIRVHREFWKHYAQFLVDTEKSAEMFKAVTTDTPDLFVEKFAGISSGGIDEQVNLICLYASEIRLGAISTYLPRQEIEDGAIGEEIPSALGEVVKLARSPLDQIRRVMG